MKLCIYPVPLFNNDVRKLHLFLSPQGEMCITGGETKRNRRITSTPK
ncbi:MAG: hypothetical protein LBU34_06700 [Planctomycetaceae bacterium]|nr:hypothetical protein [Planctomycetaceae bacterium]